LTYIGQQPSTTFDSGIQDRFTGLTTNTVTLTHDISAETDILVVWNNIVQDSGTYSVGGTGNKTLTLGGTLVSADVVTVYYLNKVMQSVNPTAGSVNTDQLATNAVTNVKMADDAIGLSELSATGTASSSTFLRGDNSWAEAGGGKINQLLHTNAVVNTTTSSDVELMSLAITPSATSSKIYMLFTGSCQMGADEYGSWDFYRGSLASGSKILDGGETVFNGYNNIRLGFSMSYLDSPSTTSATTYTVVGSAIIGSIQYGATGRNTLTLMEVLA